MDWKTLLAYITGTVDQELLLRNEYLVTENRILRHQITGRVRLTDGERKTLAEIGQKLGKQALKEVAKIVKPDTILGWHRTLVAQKFDGSQQRKAPGRPTIDQELETLVVRLARVGATRRDDLWRWQVGNRGNPFGGIGSIRTRTAHGCILLARMLRPALYDKGPTGAIPKPGKDAIVTESRVGCHLFANTPDSTRPLAVSIYAN